MAAPREGRETRADVEEAIRCVLSQHAGLELDIRLYGHLHNDEIDRIGVGRAMHPDEMGRPCFDIVSPIPGTRWREELERSVQAHHELVARLDERRRDIGVDGNARRRAWDVHPVVASILTRYPRMPTLDGSHRIDGMWGRVVDLGSAPGISSAMIAYGDGIIRLVEAVLEDGSTLTQKNDVLTMTVNQHLPDTMVIALGHARPGSIATLLEADPRAARCRTRRVRNVGESLSMDFQDVLVPWDRRATGLETWRRKRLMPDAAKKRSAASR